MRIRNALSIVPKPITLCATTILICAPLIGSIAGWIHGRAYMAARHSGGLGLYRLQQHHVTDLPAISSFIGFVGALVVGALFAAWLLGLGYVYADARRRAMPAVPWTLVAIFVPNLLGFLLYFVLRRPIASPCPQCGQAITAGQRFCPSCGYRAQTAPGGLTPAPGSST
jgi:hypothetical protein